MIDLINPARFVTLLRSKIKENNEILKAFGAAPLSFAQVHQAYRKAGDRLEGFVTNTVVLLHKAMQRGASILFEGAQGTFLDIDHGTYPFVTSSNTTAGGACTGSGVPPHRMDRVIGVVKAYATRVGEGPLPTENQEIADLLHSMGREFGATTGRPRRCGWFDAVASHHAAIINGVDELAVTNLDGLDRVETIKMCIGYQASLSRLDYVPADIELLAKCQPVYAEFPGWLTSTSHCRKWMDLPPKARSYLKALAELTGAKLKIVSIGPAREQTIVL
jgi:adenylosuccinate synthase